MILIERSVEIGHDISCYLAGLDPCRVPGLER